MQNLLAFAKGVFAKCILRRHNNFNLVAALVLGRLLLCALRNCEKIMHQDLSCHISEYDNDYSVSENGCADFE